jgi:hypothetical protein
MITCRRGCLSAPCHARRVADSRVRWHRPRSSLPEGKAQPPPARPNRPAGACASKQTRGLPVRSRPRCPAAPSLLRWASAHLR